MLRILRKSIRALRIFCAALLLGYLLFSALGGVCLAVRSGSMEPEIPTGSLVFVWPAEDIRTGDIITYRRGGILVTHRVVKKTKTGFLTQGDANPAIDPLSVSVSQITGKVILSVPCLGYLFLFSGFRYFLCMVLLLLWFFAWDSGKKREEKI